MKRGNTQRMLTNHNSLIPTICMYCVVVYSHCSIDANIFRFFFMNGEESFLNISLHELTWNRLSLELVWVSLYNSVIINGYREKINEKRICSAGSNSFNARKLCSLHTQRFDSKLNLLYHLLELKELASD